MFARWMVLFLAVLVACPSTRSRSSDDDDGSTSAAGGGGGGQGGGAMNGATPREICAQYLECLSQSSPTELGIALDAYGDSGTCWNGRDETLCATACLTGLEQHHDEAPDACPECFEDAHCGGEQCFAGDCAICEPNLTCSECVSTGCGEQLCAEQSAACAANPECNAAWECTLPCRLSAAADCNACPSLTSESVILFWDLNDCMCSTCYDASSPECTNSDFWSCDG